MNISLTPDELLALLGRTKRDGVQEQVTETSYQDTLRKWGSLPNDMELDSDGNPIVKSSPVNPDFKGVVK